MTGYADIGLESCTSLQAIAIYAGFHKNTVWGTILEPLKRVYTGTRRIGVTFAYIDLDRSLMNSLYRNMKRLRNVLERFNQLEEVVLCARNDDKFPDSEEMDDKLVREYVIEPRMRDLEASGVLRITDDPMDVVRLVCPDV